MKLLFMGTPDYAGTILKTLISENRGVSAVVTQPDKPKGRGYILTPSPVKEIAEKHGLPVYQPSTLKSDDFYSLLKKIAPDAIIVAAYGKILPQNVLDYPAFGCINVHGSLLPAYRGAAPIQRAIIEGERETGVTIMKMDAGIDTGDMYLKTAIPISDSDDFGTLHDRLAEAGARALCEVLDMIEAGTAIATPQPEKGATYASKIEKCDTVLDFSQSARAVFNRIRGLSPFPLSCTTQNGAMIKPVSAEIVGETGKYGESGQVVSLDGGITVACGDGAIIIKSLLPAGKGRMSAEDFIRGRKIAIGDVFI